MQNQNKFRLLSGALLIVAAVLFLVLNIFSGHLFKAIRFDLTTDRIYSLSTGSKDIIKNISEPIKVRLYFSKHLAQINPYLISYATRVQDLLAQYERVSRGKIVLEIIDPLPNSIAESEAIAFGLQAIPLDDLGNDLYFGLVATNSTDAKRIIPFIQPARETSLEYDLSQLLANLNNPIRPKVAVISSLPLEGRGGRPWMIWQQMNGQFDLQVLDPDVEQIPADIQMLMIVNPDTFKSAALLAIDQFVIRGGHVLAYIDPFSEATDPESAALNTIHRDPQADFTRLLNAWGVQMAPNQVVADRSLAKQVRVPVDGKPQVLRYPLWLDLMEPNFAQDDVISAGLDRMTLGTAGSLTKVENATTNFKPLIMSSPDAMLVPASQVQQYQENLAGMMQTFVPTGTHVLGARISGPIKSPYTEQEVSNSNIIVIADADMLHDHFWVMFQNVMGEEFGIPTAANGNFTVSALDNLSGSDALISIRNRGTFSRPFTRIQNLENAAQTDDMQQRAKADHSLKALESRIKFFSIGFVPLLIVICGFGYWMIQLRRETKMR